jgi:hypothetical protein
MKRFVLFILVLMLGAYACQSLRKESVFSRSNGAPVREGDQRLSPVPLSKLPASTDLHFSAQYCLECHERVPADRSALYLRYDGDFRQLCRCHYLNEQVHVHPVSGRPSPEVTIPPDYPLRDGNLTCTTCHDISIQCRNNPVEKVLRKGQDFLRGTPYKNRIDLCFNCHDQNRYPRYNPHQQLDATGAVIETKCLYCHSDVPDVKRSTNKEVHLIAPYTALCVGCHYQASKQPLHVRHIRKPPPAILEQMRKTQKELNIVLPLDNNGKITCVTCHNPHQKGLIPVESAGSTGAGAVHRHRLSGNMCIRCHPLI